MFKYHMHFEKHYQYLEDRTEPGFIRDIYFKNLVEAYNLMKKYQGNKMYNIRISLAKIIVIKSKKNRELAGKKLLPDVLLFELDEGIITDYRLHNPKVVG